MREELYKQHILDHYTHPHHKGVMVEATHTGSGSNPSCGDRLEISLIVEHDTIARAMFEGEGCAISQAAASMLTDTIMGMSVQEALQLNDAYVYAMLGVEVSVGRQACALLALRALHRALAVNEK